MFPALHEKTFKLKSPFYEEKENWQEIKLFAATSVSCLYMASFGTQFIS